MVGKQQGWFSPCFTLNKNTINPTMYVGGGKNYFSLFDGLKTMTSIYQWGRARKKVIGFQKDRRGA